MKETRDGLGLIKKLSAEIFMTKWKGVIKGIKKVFRAV